MIVSASASPAAICRSSLCGCFLDKNEFVAYIDALGRLDERDCLLEWKTTSSRYREEPDGLLALDPQLVCYSWVSGISEVAQIVFVRKRLVEIQYLRTAIRDEQREEFGILLQTRSGELSLHSFCRVAASVSRRTLAPVAPIWDFASDDRSWSTPPWWSALISWRAQT
jgi:hypothetical protein